MKKNDDDIDALILFLLAVLLGLGGWVYWWFWRRKATPAPPIDLKRELLLQSLQVVPIVASVAIVNPPPVATSLEFSDTDFNNSEFA